MSEAPRRPLNSNGGPDDLRERINAAIKHYGWRSDFVLLATEGEGPRGVIRPIREWAAIRGDCEEAFLAMQADLAAGVIVCAEEEGGRIVWHPLRWHGCGPEQLN
jgi:hypothetical protein